MPTTIVANNEPMPSRREELSNAVVSGMEARSGNFRASILVDQARSAIQIEISGERKRWLREFDGVEELQIDYIRRAIEQATFSVLA